MNDIKEDVKEDVKDDVKGDKNDIKEGINDVKGSKEDVKGSKEDVKGSKKEETQLICVLKILKSHNFDLELTNQFLSTNDPELHSTLASNPERTDFIETLTILHFLCLQLIKRDNWSELLKHQELVSNLLLKLSPFLNFDIDRSLTRCYAIDNNQLTISANLLSWISHINYGISPHATKNIRRVYMKIALNHGANPNIISKPGLSAFDRCALFGSDFGLVRILLKNGYNIDKTNLYYDGFTGNAYQYYLHALKMFKKKHIARITKLLKGWKRFKNIINNRVYFYRRRKMINDLNALTSKCVINPIDADQRLNKCFDPELSGSARLLDMVVSTLTEESFISGSKMLFGDGWCDIIPIIAEYCV